MLKEMVDDTIVQTRDPLYLCVIIFIVEYGMGMMGLWLLLIGWSSGALLYLILTWWLLGFVVVLVSDEFIFRVMVKVQQSVDILLENMNLVWENVRSRNKFWYIFIAVIRLSRLTWPMNLILCSSYGKKKLSCTRRLLRLLNVINQTLKCFKWDIRGYLLL